jgi:2-polyprenyl-3-methyl-5-hydroxy-6-metoxy-1,4-benzoquinol methylase
LHHLDGQNAKEWETRSKRFGDALKSVLFKGLPEIVNEHLHNWHKHLILERIEEKEGLNILDAGCGYGRLSLPIIEKFPKVNIKGIDISENYVSLYQKNTHRSAIVGAIEDMPETLGSFDYVICVTVLMYLDDRKLKKAISHLLFHLKKGGELILIEPHRSGIPFETGFGMVTLLRLMTKRDQNDLRSRYFTSKEIGNYFHDAGGKISRERRLPVTSVFFLPIILIGKLLPYGTATIVFKMVSLFDALLGRFKFPSIYAAYLIQKRWE